MWICVWGTANYVWWLRKKSNFFVALHLLSMRRTICTPYSSRFARLELELFALPSHFRFFTGSSILAWNNHLVKQGWKSGWKTNCTNKKRAQNFFWTLCFQWRERRDSNSRPPAWQAGVLTRTELRPLNQYFFFYNWQVAQVRDLPVRTDGTF